MLKEYIKARSIIDEQAHITGVALIPRISRNNNLYTKEELRRFDGKKVPLNWEHNPGKTIGNVTFHYNSELETVYYDGMITDDAAADLARNKALYTSIEADPVSMKEICNSPDDCFHMPFGLVPVGMALTETPGIPETSVRVIENYLNECEIDHGLEAKYVPEQSNLNNELHIKNLTEPHEILYKEQGRGEPNDDCISSKISKIADDHPEWSSDKRVAVAISMCSESEVKEYLLERHFKIVQFCAHCGEYKQKPGEAVGFDGPQARPDMHKKKAKKIQAPTKSPKDLILQKAR